MQKKLKDYLYKLERLIADENYLELEYAAECFTCAVREIAAKTITVSKTKSLIPCTGSMGIAVQKNDDILKLTLP